MGVPGIYLKHGETYVSMAETPYDREGVLQALVAQHHEVLVDETAGQGPLLLVRREAAVADEEGVEGRWSLDHLYVDSSGIPTLVEVKRSSDTRGRREVVAQMLDYAANARLSFSAERMAAWLEDDAKERGKRSPRRCPKHWAWRIRMRSGRLSRPTSTPSDSGSYLCRT
jgi:hypothetical protein